MTVPTLPVIGQPPLWFFMCLDYVGEALAHILLVAIFLVGIPYYSRQFYNAIRSTRRCATCMSKLTACLEKRSACLGKFTACLGKYTACLGKCAACLGKCECPNFVKKCPRRCRVYFPCLCIFISRKLNVRMFSGLFKEHKDRYRKVHDSRWKTRQFMLFLDRKVESSALIIYTFYLLTWAILSSALLVFFRYIS